MTFLFTDIEGSTRLLQELGSDYAAVLEEHAEIIRSAVSEGGGTVVSTEGDGSFCVFPTAPEAVRAAAQMQRGLQTHDWPDGVAVPVRMGLHTGAGVLGGDDYVGLDVHRAARIAGAGHGGQVLLSETTRSLVENALPDGTRLLDLGLHRLKDLERPERLHTLVMDGLEQDFPALRTLDAVDNNLPAPLTSFVGREREVSQVRRLLSQTRLVTLTGAGGTGKTRLATQAAGSLQGRFSDGIWFVPLEEIDDPSLLATSIMDGLGHRYAGGDAYGQLIQHLGRRQTLLVLDNFEHLIRGGARTISDLLQDCPDLRVLVTSRAPLRISGEQELRVPPLPGPDDDDPDAGSITTDHPAIRLFVDRATAVRPDFELTESNAAAVAAITARLDGLPLAIELAAALVNVLTPQAILERLEQRMDILRGGPQDRPERQRSMRAAMRWSYELLDEADRRLFERLGVFVGGASLTMIERVAPDEGDLNALLAGLRTLVDHSLLTRQDVGDEPRFLMVNTIREFALEQLEDEGDEDATRRRHAGAFRALAEEADAGLRGREEARWVSALDREFANLRAAVTWGRAEGECDLVLPTVVALFWYAQSQFREEVVRWAETALELPEAASHPYFVPVCGVASWGNGMGGQLSRAVELAERGLRAAPDPADPARLLPLFGLGQAALFDGRLDDALEHIREAAHLTDDPLERMFTRIIESLALTYGGDVDGGLEVAAHLRREAEQTGIPSLMCWTNYLEGEALARRDPERALASFDDAIALAETVRARFVAGVAQLSATSLRARHGDAREALTHLRELIETWRRTSAGAPLWTAMRSVAEVFVRIGSPEVAAIVHTAITRGDIGVEAYGDDAERLGALAETLDERLTESQAERARARGRSLTEDDVVDFVIAEMDRLLAEAT